MEMPMFIGLGKFTQKGIENMKDSPERLEAARKVAKSVGGEIKEFYYTMGRYDFVVIAEAPNDEAMMKNLLIVGGVGCGQNRNNASHTSGQSSRHPQGTTVRKQFDWTN